MHYLSLPGNTGRFLLFPLFEGVAFIAISCRESAEWESKPRTLSALKLPPAKLRRGRLLLLGILLELVGFLPLR
jgi:hypothetical protein